MLLHYSLAIVNHSVHFSNNLINARMNQHASIASYVVCYKNDVPYHQVESGYAPALLP